MGSAESKNSEANIKEQLESLLNIARSNGESVLDPETQDQQYEFLNSIKERISPAIYKEILLEALPYTTEAIRLRTELATGWYDTNEEVFARIERGKERGARIYRAPGSDIFGLDDKELSHNFDWETESLIFLNTWDGQKESLIEFGQKVAQELEIDNKEEIKNFAPRDVDTHVLTYHYEPADPNNPHPHSCGAHASNTKRAILQLIPTLATLAYAYEGEDVDFMVQAHRTKLGDIKPALLDIPQSYEEFLAAHFKDGVSSDEMNEEVLIEGANKDKIASSIRFHELHQALFEINQLFPNAKEKVSKKDAKYSLLGCVDDRVKVAVLTENGEIEVIELSSMEHHAADSFYITLGRKARNIISYDEHGAPLCYRGAVLPGINKLDSSHIDIARKELMYQVPLILKYVMSEEFSSKAVYIDVVISAEDDAAAQQERNEFRMLMAELRTELASQSADIQINWRIIEEHTKTIERGTLEIVH